MGTDWVVKLPLRVRQERLRKKQQQEKQKERQEQRKQKRKFKETEPKEDSEPLESKSKSNSNSKSKSKSKSESESESEAESDYDETNSVFTRVGSGCHVVELYVEWIEATVEYIKPIDPQFSKQLQTWLPGMFGAFPSPEYSEIPYPCDKSNQKDCEILSDILALPKDLLMIVVGYNRIPLVDLDRLTKHGLTGLYYLLYEMDEQYSAFECQEIISTFQLISRVFEFGGWKNKEWIHCKKETWNHFREKLLPVLCAAVRYKTPMHCM